MSKGILECLLHQECNYRRNLKLDGPSSAVCHVALPWESQKHSLTPKPSAANKRAVDFLIILALLFSKLALLFSKLAFLFSKLEKAERFLEAAKEVIHN